MNMRYRAQDAISFATRVGLSLGMGDSEADEFARSMVYADMRGLHSHGLMRMPVYVQRIRQGLVSVGGGIQILHDDGTLLSSMGTTELAPAQPCAPWSCVWNGHPLSARAPRPSATAITLDIPPSSTDSPPSIT